MESLFKNYFWVLNLLVLTAAAYLTATTANEVLSDALFGGDEVEAKADPDKKKGGEEKFSPRKGTKKAYASLLDGRNVFDSDRAISDEEPDEGGEEDKGEEELKPQEGELQDTELDLTLVGTSVGPEPDFSLATMHFGSEAKLVRVGSELKRNQEDEDVLAKVLEIHRRYVVIQEGNERRAVRLWAERKSPKKPGRGARKDPRKPPKAGKNPPRGGKPKTDYSKGIRKVSMYKYEVDRNMLDEQLADLSQIGREARIVPNYRNGQYQGFKLIGVRPGSLYRALGIRSGDIIQRVNGDEINSPNKAISLFEQLKAKPNIALDIERRGQKRTLTYDIK